MEISIGMIFAVILVFDAVQSNQETIETALRAIESENPDLAETIRNVLKTKDEKIRQVREENLNILKEHSIGEEVAVKYPITFKKIALRAIESENSDLAEPIYNAVKMKDQEIRKIKERKREILREILEIQQENLDILKEHSIGEEAAAKYPLTFKKIALQAIESENSDLAEAISSAVKIKDQEIHKIREDTRPN